MHQVNRAKAAYSYLANSAHFAQCDRQNVARNHNLKVNRFIRVFGRDRVYAGCDEVRQQIRSAAEAHLRQRFSTGIYNTHSEVNALLHHLYQFYSDKAKRLVRKLASRDFMEFILYQYELTTLVNDAELNNSQKSFWQEIGPVLRRALKFIAEQTALRSPPQSTVMSDTRLIFCAQEAIICAMEMVQVYHASDVTHALFPQHTVAEVYPPGGEHLYALSLTEPYSDVFSAFNARVERHEKHQSEYIPILTIDVDPEKQTEILDPYFKSGFGTPYTAFCGVITHVIEDPQTLPTRYPIPFCEYKTLVNEIVKNNIPPELCTRILAGFTLSHQTMLAEGREMWNVKQEHRAFRRPFFEFPHDIGPHLVWSKGMAKESFLALLSGASFQKMPPEWQIPEVKKGLSELSNRTGKWFEDIAVDVLSHINLIGSPYKTNIPVGGRKLDIPAEIGQIDFLAGLTEENALVIAEFKMVEMATEPKLFRDDVSQFVSNKKSFSNQFLRKVDWVWDNSRLIAPKYRLNADGVRCYPIMITMYPTFASTFIKDFPCVSLIEFMLDYKEKQRWPYSFGLRT